MSMEESKRAAKMKRKRAERKAATKAKRAEAKARDARMREVEDISLLHEVSLAARDLARKEGRPLPHLSMPPPPLRDEDQPWIWDSRIKPPEVKS